MRATPLFASTIAAAFVAAAAATTLAMDNEIVGTWVCLSATVNGKALPEETVKALQLTLTKDRYKTERSGETLFDSAYTIDTGSDPKQINMTGTEGDLKGKQAQGIYAVANDLLRICYTMPGQERPKAFESAPGSNAFLVVWKRRN